MRSEEFGYQVGVEKSFPVETKVPAQEVDFLGKEDARNAAAGPAVFTGAEMLFWIPVNNPPQASRDVAEYAVEQIIGSMKG